MSVQRGEYDAQGRISVFRGTGYGTHGHRATPDWHGTVHHSEAGRVRPLPPELRTRTRSTNGQATRTTSQNASLQHAPSSISVRMSASRSALTVWPVGLAESQTPFGV